MAAGVWVLGGSADDPEPIAGATHLLEHLTLRRCGGRGRAELAQLVDRLGGAVDAWTGAETMGVSVLTTVDALGSALDLLLDATMTPTFDRADVELERRVAQAELELVRSDPEDRVDEELLQAAWGDHPLARPIIGSSETLRRLTPEVLRRRHRAMVVPGRVLAIVVGDVDPLEVAGRLAALPLDRTLEPPRLPAPAWAGSSLTIDWPATEQVHARIAFPTGGVGDPGRPALAVLNRILGIGASSRLFQRLREEEGLTYDVFSSLVVRRDAGLLEIGWAAGADAFATCRSLVLEELGRVAGSVSANEVEVAVEAIVRGLEMEAETTDGVLGLEAAEVLDHGRRFDLGRAIAEIKAVGVEEVRELALRTLDPSRMATAVCGPRSVVERVA